jgi:hypothetical protein
MDVNAVAKDTLTVKRTFGEPYSDNGLTVIPTAAVAGMAGGITAVVFALFILPPLIVQLTRQHAVDHGRVRSCLRQPLPDPAVGEEIQITA